MTTSLSRALRVAACLLALSAAATGAQEQAELPLTGPAYRLADQAYKDYARGEYNLAADKARRALLLRPDSAQLHTLLKNAEAARGVPRAAPLQQRAGSGGSRVARDPAFVSADAGYKSYARGKYSEAVAHASKAVSLAPRNRAYRVRAAPRSPPPHHASGA